MMTSENMEKIAVELVELEIREKEKGNENHNTRFLLDKIYIKEGPIISSMIEMFYFKHRELLIKDEVENKDEVSDYEPSLMDLEMQKIENEELLIDKEKDLEPEHKSSLLSKLKNLLTMDLKRKPK